MVMVDPQLFQSEWFVNLPVDDRYMYLYLLMMSDNKIGTIEWNERMINFCANTGKNYTKNDILAIYGGRVQEVPNHPNTLIIVSYLKFNWLKDGRELDPHKNLDKAIMKQLARYGLSIEKLNEMEGKAEKIRIKAVEERTVAETPKPVTEAVQKPVVRRLPATSKNDIATMFDAFWRAYPGPRKQDKKKCSEKFARILSASKDAVKQFNDIMAGLEKWKESKLWQKDGGDWIKMPMTWLNNENWNDEVETGGSAEGTVDTNSIAARIMGRN